MTSSAIRVVGHRLPGRIVGEHRNVHVGVQRGREVVDAVSADADQVQFEVPLQIVGDAGAEIDFRGPFSQGKRGGRFVYLSWGDVGDDGTFTMFSRTKINLPSLPEEFRTALADGRRVRVEVDLTDVNGKLVTGSVPADRLSCSLE